MKRHHRYAKDFLFALNIFVVFLLLFENKLMVPLWLQPFGRMHPMILHFPIVLLLLSMVLEFFRFKTGNNSQESYQNFITNLLLVGVISSGITVVMGIFLSQEEAYTDSVLNWHKWTGVSVFFVASLIYTSRDATWYKAPVAKAGAIVTTLCLIFAGHYGAALTHGDNFIWQPVLASNHEVVPIEEAILFDHVIKPIIDSKCLSCHNPDKLKGRLSLVDSISLLKGGKTGALFVSGKPDSSLLFTRINLPLEDKKHMPPSGKSQLTTDEVTLLYLWVKRNAQFSKRITSLSAGDSLRLLATKFLEPGNKSATFQFAAADEQTIKNLNTNYCVVSPVAKQSPALAVNIYNRSAYNPETLEKLKPIKTQLVSLDLSRMPVKNDDLSTLATFRNLHRLNLNFTDITGEGLKVLSPLNNLKSLYLSGTRMNLRQLQMYLTALKSLQTVAVWDTDLSARDVENLRRSYSHIQFLDGYQDDGTNLIKLNAPKIKNKTVVFNDSISVELFHPVKGVDVRYTTDGSEPDSVASPSFKGKTVLHQTTGLKVRAYKKGWLSSNVAELYVYKSSHKPDSIISLSKLNRVHQAKGGKTFFDHQLGTFNANSPAWANNWAGFIKNDMEMLIQFKNPRQISSVSLNTLIETETFIFPPAALEIWGGDTEKNMRLLGRMKPEQPTDYRKPFIKVIQCDVKPRNVSYLKVIAKPVAKLPAWHKSKDRAALLLIDEMLIN